MIYVCQKVKNIGHHLLRFGHAPKNRTSLANKAIVSVSPKILQLDL